MYLLFQRNEQFGMFAGPLVTADQKVEKVLITYPSSSFQNRSHFNMRLKGHNNNISIAM